jgi:MFS family permease
VTLLLYAAFHAITVMLPMNLIRIQGYRAGAAGLALLPVVALVILLAPVAGRMADRFGPRRPLVLGTLLAALGLLLLSVPGVTAGPGEYARHYLVPCILLGAGIGLSITPLSAMIMGSVSSGQYGLASAITGATSRLAGIAAVVMLGVTLLAVFPRALEHHARGLPPQVRSSVIAQASKLAELPSPSNRTSDDGNRAASAVKLAFVDAFRALTWAAAALALSAAAAGGVLLRGDPSNAAEATPQDRSTLLAAGDPAHDASTSSTVSHCAASSNTPSSIP